MITTVMSNKTEKRNALHLRQERARIRMSNNEKNGKRRSPTVHGPFCKPVVVDHSKMFAQNYGHKAGQNPRHATCSLDFSSMSSQTSIWT